MDAVIPNDTNLASAVTTYKNIPNKNSNHMRVLVKKNTNDKQTKTSAGPLSTGISSVRPFVALPLAITSILGYAVIQNRPKNNWKKNKLKHSKFNVHQNANENNEITVEVEDILSALVDEMRLPLFVSSDDTNDGNDDPNRMMVIENAFDELESERQDFEAQVEQEFKNFGNAAAAHWNSDKDDDVQSFSTDDNNKSKASSLKYADWVKRTISSIERRETSTDDYIIGSSRNNHLEDLLYHVSIDEKGYDDDDDDADADRSTATTIIDEEEDVSSVNYVNDDDDDVDEKNGLIDSYSSIEEEEEEEENLPDAYEMLGFRFEHNSDAAAVLLEGGDESTIIVDSDSVNDDGDSSSNNCTTNYNYIPVAVDISVSDKGVNESSEDKCKIKCMFLLNNNKSKTTNNGKSQLFKLINHAHNYNLKSVKAIARSTSKQKSINH
jgi:hypothetical protein